jgi:myo-inositol 2-dehydrogenase / D-chiro-inositol 1-dehydrogenase
MAAPASLGGAVNRRRFLAATGAAALGFTWLQPELVGAAESDAKVKFGLIGCGGRGKWIAELFQKHGGFQVAAVADYFEDRAKAAGDKFGVPAARQFTGLNGYQRMLELKEVDAVVIETPPYFHPIHAAAAVAAGKHVYLAKPIAVDVPGCLTVEASGRQATAQKRCFLIDFQTRAHPAYQEAVRKVQAGDIGRVVNGEATYLCDSTWGGMDPILRQDPANPEVRLRAWGVDRILSGDVISEQNIHAIDVATWFLNAAPLKAYGAGGKTRDFVGDCWDHFAVIYHFPKEILISFTSKQVGKFWDDILCRIYGTEGTADTHYFGEVNVLCDDPFKGGRLGNLYTDGVVNNIATFHKSIGAGDYSNPTVPPSVRSNLTAILGRTAAYAKREVTWEEMIKTNEPWEFSGLKGLKG